MKKMILTGLLFGFVLSFAVVSSKEVEPVTPSSVSETSSDVDPVSNLLLKLDDVALVPETRGRSDVEIEEEEIPQEQPPRGYFYPKPSKPFELPVFKTLQPLDGSSFLIPTGLEDEGEFERVPRSPQRPQSLFPYPNIQGYRPRPRPQQFYPLPPTNFPNRFPGYPLRPLSIPGAPYRL